MPRNVRNFWISADIDGRKHNIRSGPVRKDGGFTLRILVRDKGNILQGLRVEGIAHDDGRLELVTFPSDDQGNTTQPITMATVR